MAREKSNPYSDNPNRLADVIAAIQVLGTYKFYKSDFSEWAHRISGDRKQGAYWKKIFEDHPEFFRLNKQQDSASLVWRRNYQKLYDMDEEETISKETYRSLTKKQKERISRNPLTNSDISTLISAAIDIHAKELDRKKDARWWISGVIGLAGVIIGAIIKAISG